MLTTLAALGVLTLPLAAQEAHRDHEKPGAEQKEMMREGMMMEMTMGPLSGELGGFVPARLLEAGRMLDLTPAQTTRLTALRDGLEKDLKAAHELGHKAHEALNKAIAAATLDRAAARTHFLAHHDAMGRMQWLRVAAALDARAVLTEAQRAHVQRMKEHHGEGKHEH